SGRAGRAGSSKSGGAGGPEFPPLGGARNSDRGEGRSLGECDLARVPQLEQRKERDRLLDPRELPDLALEVEAAAAPQHGAEPLQELRDGREAKLHVRERESRRLGRQRAQRARELRRILWRKPALRPWGERRGAEPEEAVR